MDEDGACSDSGPKLGPNTGGRVDLISTLPDDLLLQVLERLGSYTAAARTSILSRRWRGLWACLPKVTITLHDGPFGSLESALRRAALRPRLCHYLLDIRVPMQDDMVNGSRVSSLLYAAAGLSPAELRFTLPGDFKIANVLPELPCFRRATSIELSVPHLRIHQRMTSFVGWGLFHSLERLSLSGCHINLAALIPRCPRLRLLSLNTTEPGNMCDINIQSASLEELVFENKNRWAGLSRINIDAPVLKQLTTYFHAYPDVKVSILAPLVEKVSWRCLYTRVIYGIGLWGLSEVGFERRGRTDMCSSHVLSLHMCAKDSLKFPNAQLSFATDIDKHTVTNFSSLDLHLTTKGHVFGAFVLHLLGMHRIRTAIQNLKIVLLGSQVKDTCQVNCLCDKPRRTQSVSLVNLEKVEIEGVKGVDHEFDFLKLIFRCSPMLKKVTVRLSHNVTPSVVWCTKINKIVKAYPVVECDIDLGPGSTNSSQTCGST